MELELWNWVSWIGKAVSGKMFESRLLYPHALPALLTADKLEQIYSSTIFLSLSREANDDGMRYSSCIALKLAISKC